MRCIICDSECSVRIGKTTLSPVMRSRSFDHRPSELSLVARGSFVTVSRVSRLKTVFAPDWPFAPKRWPFFYGWVIAAGSTLGIVCSIPGQTMVMSVFADRFIEAAEISRTQLSDAYLMGTLLSGLLVSIGGVWFDRLGARLFFTLFVTLFGFAVMGMSQIDRLAFALQRLLTPADWVKMMAFVVGFFLIRFLGQGMVTIGARSMLSKWWNRKRGQVTAVSGVLVAGFFSSAPVVLEAEVAAFGWRGAWLFNGLALCTVVAFGSWLFFRDNPEECGLKMDGPFVGDGKEETNADMFIVRDFTRAEAIRTYSFWVFALGLATQAMFATAYTFHVVDVGRAGGVEKERILSYFAYSLFATIPTNLFCGYIVEFIRLRFVLVLLGAAGALMGVGMLLLPNTSGEVLLVIGMGTSWGTFPVLSSVTYARYFGRTHLGAISGLAMSLTVFGSALGPALFARGPSWFKGYSEVTYLMIAAYLTVCIAALFASNPQRKLAPSTD